MATLTIRNLNDDVRDAIRQRAQANGRSTEAEVRLLLELSVAQSVTRSATGPTESAEHRCNPRRRFADIEPIEIDHPESSQEILDYLRGDR
jgi:plasmid stability protein